MNKLLGVGVRTFRMVERVMKKVVSCRWKMVFLRACLSEHLLPKFAINIYIYIYIFLIKYHRIFRRYKFFKTSFNSSKTFPRKFHLKEFLVHIYLFYFSQRVSEHRYSILKAQ